ncbi:MAG: helix-turn-helix domain-containing protein [Deltaproteobacteria bacterium]|nr:helix-turn-helix domain-containing protein [Deltaproteobacteria bacterium]
MAFIKSVEKAVDILSCFTIETPVLTVGEITRLTGLNQSTVSRLLATLALKKCLEQTGPAGQYCLGVKFYQWGSVLRQKANLADLARPVMERLRDI